MKKLIFIALILVVLLSLTGCAGEKTAELPLNGFHGFENGLIIEVDESDFLVQENKTVENAYVFEDGKLLKLKAKESKFILNPEISNVAEETTLEIKYYVHSDTVYCYQKTDYRQQGITFEFFTIPNDSENVLISGTVMKKPMILNVKSGELKVLFDEVDVCRLVGLSLPLISEDGKYVVVLCGTKYEAARNELNDYYVINLKTSEAKQLPKIIIEQNREPMPNDNEAYYKHSTTPYAFVGDEILLTYTMKHDKDESLNMSEAYYYNLENEETREWDKEIDFSEYTDGYPGHHILMQKDISSGECYLYNIKTNKEFYYKPGVSTEIYGTPNQSGRFILGGLKEWPIHNNGSVDNTIGAYVTHALIDMEKGEIVDIEKYVKDFTFTEYKGKTVINMQWIGETNLLVVYGNEQERYTDIIDLSAAIQ